MIADFLDNLIVKTAHGIGAFVYGVVRLYVYAQVFAALMFVVGLIGLGLYFTLRSLF